MVAAIEVVGFFAEQATLDRTSICPLKAQKLLYYAQGYALALEQTSAFNEAVEAWQYGPVVPEVYRELRRFGSDALPAQQYPRPDGLDQELERVLLHVWKRFGSLPPGKLVGMTHKEQPWKDAWARGQNSEITREAMQTFFERALRRGRLKVDPIPPKRTLYVTKSRFEERPEPWLHASKTGAVVHVYADGEAEPVVTFGQHHTLGFLEPDEHDPAASGVAQWLA